MFMRSLVYLFFLSFLSSCLPNNIQRPAATIYPESDQIMGGTVAGENEFPFVVNIWLNTPRDQFVAHICGGSLIDSRWVLTAAHCVFEEATETSQRTIKPGDFQLYMGSSHISGVDGKVLKVKSVWVHPDFSWPHHDLALLELVHEVKDIVPVELSSEDFGDASQSLEATVIGWGLVDAEGKKDAEWLQKLNLPLVSRELCAQDKLPQKRSWDMSSDILCAKTFYNQKASCHGDSGGPLLWFNGSTYEQIGVVSWGTACSGTRSQNFSDVEGHAAVADAYEWIQSVIK